MKKHNRLVVVLAVLLCGWGLSSAEIATEVHSSQKQGPRSDAKASRTQKIWRDPGAVEKLDFVGGPGGRSGSPRPPFKFVEEDLGGSNPKVKVTDRSEERRVGKECRSRRAA